MSTNTILNSIAVAVPTGIAVQVENPEPVIVSAILTFIIEIFKFFRRKKDKKKELKAN